MRTWSQKSKIYPGHAQTCPRRAKRRAGLRTDYVLRYPEEFADFGVRIMTKSTTQISFEVSSDVLHSLNQNPAEFTQQTRLLVALHLFKTHKLSLGQAIALANLNREQFLAELDKHDIPLIAYDPAELAAELERFDP